jgi:hypothetical protein
VASAAVHGNSGLDGSDLPEPTRRPLDAYAVDFMIEMADRYRGDLVLATCQTPPRRQLASSHLLGLGQPIHVGNMAVYLASNESEITTGQIISVDSGVTFRGSLPDQSA